MDLRQIYRQSAELFSSYVKNVGPTGWDSQTPDPGWDITALVHHVTENVLWVPDLLAGKTIAEVGDKYSGDVLGDDPKAAWAAASVKAVASVDKLTDLQQTTHV